MRSMIMNKSVIHIINRNIKQNGKIYEFTVVGRDEFGQEVETDDKVEILGLFHQYHAFTNTIETRTARTIIKPRPLLLVQFKDWDILQKDYITEINDKKYKVIDKENISQLSLVCDISLELIYDGSSD